MAAHTETALAPWLVAARDVRRLDGVAAQHVNDAALRTVAALLCGSAARRRPEPTAVDDGGGGASAAMRAGDRTSTAVLCETVRDSGALVQAVHELAFLATRFAVVGTADGADESFFDALATVMMRRTDVDSSSSSSSSSRSSSEYAATNVFHNSDRFEALADVLLRVLSPPERVFVTPSSNTLPSSTTLPLLSSSSILRNSVYQTRVYDALVRVVDQRRRVQHLVGVAALTIVGVAVAVSVVGCVLVRCGGVRWCCCCCGQRHASWSLSNKLRQRRRRRSSLRRAVVTPTTTVPKSRWRW